MTFAEQLVSNLPRETSGSRASSRFDFQKNWVLCHLLELHLEKRDYLVLCDYHDDVVVLERPSNPDQAEFIQIKTKKTGRRVNH